jgi:hypothetical protein
VDLLLRQEVRRVVFLEQGIALVFLVHQNALDCGLAPFVLSPRRFNAQPRQLLGDGVAGKPRDEIPEMKRKVRRYSHRQNKKARLRTFLVWTNRRASVYAESNGLMGS